MTVRVVSSQTVLPSRPSAHTCPMDTSVYHRSPFTLVLSIVVVSADSGVALRECVRNVLAGTLPLELILIDNDSHDGVPEAIERAYAHDNRFKEIGRASCRERVCQYV